MRSMPPCRPESSGTCSRASAAGASPLTAASATLIFDLYEALQQETVKLQEAHAKIQTHLKLLNEDVDKFNLSYDFGLIAAQIEAMDGGRDESMSGGLLSSEREELSTRMRFKRQKLTDEQLPPAPALPPLAEIKSRLESVLDRIYAP